MSAKKKKAVREQLTATVFLLPSLIGLVLFSLIPLVFSLFISLTDWNFLNGMGDWNFIGLENFLDMWTDEWFLASLKNTFIYTIVVVPIGLFLALIIAALIDSFISDKLANVLRVTMYMPKICNIVASAAIWIMLYSTYGPFTQLMRLLGWENPPHFLASYTWALPAIMLMSIWSGLGYHVFIYSAGMAGISRDLYEAAELDGAGAIQKFWYVTIPQLRPTTFFLMITGIIGSFKVFGSVNVMTQGGPGHSTYTLVYYIYKSAFSYYNMGYASAVAVILFLILLVVTLIQWKHNNGSSD